jgi:hypothetical protein
MIFKAGFSPLHAFRDSTRLTSVAVPKPCRGLARVIVLLFSAGVSRRYDAIDESFLESS